MLINMWPFSTIRELRETCVGYINDNKLYISKVHDLERTVEVLTGANGVLITELEQTKIREAHLLSKIFDFTGLNKNTKEETQPVHRDPINIGNGKKPWPAVKEALELESRRKYWEAKGKKEPSQETISKTEEELLSEDVL